MLVSRRTVRRGEDGAATAELALGIPLLVALTAGLVWMLAVGAAQVRVIDASREAARAVAHEAELLYFGPAGGGGNTWSVVPALGVTPAYVPRELVLLETEVLTA